MLSNGPALVLGFHIFTVESHEPDKVAKILLAIFSTDLNNISPAYYHDYLSKVAEITSF